MATAPEAFFDTAVAEWMTRQRWFATKSRGVVSTSVDDRLRVGTATLYVVRMVVDGSAVDRYVVALAPGPAIVDAFDDAGFCRGLLALVGATGTLRGERGTLVGRPSRGLPASLPADAPVRRISAEQSN